MCGIIFRVVIYLSAFALPLTGCHYPEAILRVWFFLLVSHAPFVLVVRRILEAILMTFALITGTVKQVPVSSHVSRRVLSFLYNVSYMVS